MGFFMSRTTTWVTVRVAAERLGLSYDHARTLLYQHKLKGARCGGPYSRLLVDAADLERLVRERQPRAL